MGSITKHMNPEARKDLLALEAALHLMEPRYPGEVIYSHSKDGDPLEMIAYSEAFRRIRDMADRLIAEEVLMAGGPKDPEPGRETRCLVPMDEIIEQLEFVKRKLEFVADLETDSVKFDVKVLEGCISSLQEHKEADHG